MQEKASNISRRKFLGAASGLAAASISGLATGSILAQETKDTADKSTDKIITRKLGRTGITVPIVSMGVMNADSPGIVRASYDLGIRHFDTAASYQFGRNEQMVGSVLKKMGVRENAIIGTKIGAPAKRVDDPKAAVKKLIELCEGSLRRLKTDYIDILYIHSVSDPEVVPDQALMDGLAELKNQQKIRFAGISTHTRMNEVISKATEIGFYDVILTSINFTMADDAALLTAIDNAAAKGIGIIAMKTQAGGTRIPNPDTLRKFSSSVVATAALKWTMRRESIATSIPGFDNYDHMRQDFSVATTLEYSPDEKAFLSENDIKLTMGFCRQCRGCLASCPHGVEIPTLMRTHMYAAQYANFDQARRAIGEVPSNHGLSLCSSCSTCTAKCNNSVDIARKIDELKLMYA